MSVASDTTRFSGVELQIQPTNDATSHSPQALAWGQRRLHNIEPFQRFFSDGPRRVWEVIGETVKTVE